MVASVQELLLAAQAKYQRPQSKIGELADIINGGVQNFGDAQSKYLDISRKMLERKAMEEAAKQREADRVERASLEERGLRNQVHKLGMGIGVTPIEKLDTALKESEEITLSNDGKFSRTYKTTEKTPGKIQPQVYQDSEGKNRIGTWGANGLIVSPNDPLAEKKVDTSGGVSNELRYRMDKDRADRAEKEAAAAKARTVPGFEPTGEVLVDDVEAKNLRGAVSEFETFKQGLNDYRNLINQYGTSEITDRNIQGQMSAYAKNLQLKVKNLAQLGVLSASDIPFIEEQLPTPGVFKTKEGMLGALNSAEKLMQSSIDNRMKTSGYKSKGGGTAPTFNTVEEAEAANLPPGTKIMIGGRSATVQ